MKTYMGYGGNTPHILASALDGNEKSFNSVTVTRAPIGPVRVHGL
jgi:hypothetical protein